jgi:hypothetical protein
MDCMASIRRQGQRFEIRECEMLKDGPRQRALARFTRILTPEVLDRAAALARRPFDRAALVARARARGIPVAESRRGDEGQRLISYLHRGGALDPMTVSLLRDALGLLKSCAIPEHLEASIDSLGQSEAERGRTLRGLLRTASRVARSRGPVRENPTQPFPRFSSHEELV